MCVCTYFLGLCGKCECCDGQIAYNSSRAFEFIFIVGIWVCDVGIPSKVCNFRTGRMASHIGRARGSLCASRTVYRASRTNADLSPPPLPTAATFVSRIPFMLITPWISPLWHPDVSPANYKFRAVHHKMQMDFYSAKGAFTMG